MSWGMPSAGRAKRGLSQGALQRIEEHIDIAGHQIGQRGLRAVVGHVHHLDAAKHFELAAGQMRGRADALRGERKLARIGLAVGDQLLHRLRWKIRPHRQHVGDLGKQCHRHEFGRIIFEVMVE